MKDNNNAAHVRNTLGILMNSQSHSSVNISDIISESKCSKIMVSLLYNRMLCRVLGGTRSYSHASIRMPNGVHGKLGSKSIFKEWFLANEKQTDMNSHDMLKLGKLSGWHSAWRSLISIGLVRVNNRNMVVLEYPINGKFYSIEYAGNVMRGVLKNKVDKQENVSDTSDNIDVTVEKDFWEKE